MSLLVLVAAAAEGVARLAEIDEAPAPSEIKPGWVALVIVLTLCVATTLLWLNMRKQLKKIDFQEKEIPRSRGAHREVGQADRSSD